MYGVSTLVAGVITRCKLAHARASQAVASRRGAAIQWLGRTLWQWFSLLAFMRSIAQSNSVSRVRTVGWWHDDRDDELSTCLAVILSGREQMIHQYQARAQDLHQDVHLCSWLLS